MSPPEIIFGSASFGTSFPTAESIEPLVSALSSSDIRRIDTAARYGGGKSEELLQASGLAASHAVDTKVLYQRDGSETLTADAISKSVDNSLGKLGKINVLYAHGPDPSTPFQETAESFDRAYRDGKFKKLGLSNFSGAQIRKYVGTCNSRGYVLPTVYQGEYNMLNRAAEGYLFDTVRCHELCFVAFSPLAGGFLTSRVKDDVEALTGSRWASGGCPKRYAKEEVFACMRKLQDISDSSRICIEDLALRWLCWHSELDGEKGDAIVIGASKVKNVKDSVAAFRQGPLPQDVLAKLNEVSQQLEGVF